MHQAIDTHIRRVAVVSTGSVRIRPQHARRTWLPLIGWLLTSRKWTKALPINVYVVEHERGLVLFDAGQDYRSVSESSYFPGGVIGWLFRRLAQFTIRPDESVSALLRSIGFDPAAVTHVVLSHLHQDHIGGIAEFPGAEIVVSATEWAQLARATAILDGYMRQHIDKKGIRWNRVSFARVDGAPLGELGPTLDLFGDGSLRLVSTPGHTPGSLAMLISVADRPTALLVGDLTYDAQHFDEDHVPGVGDAQTLRATTRKVGELAAEHQDLVIAAAHDPSAADAFRAAFARVNS